MNRKNLTAAVLAGLAGAAGIAGTAQAVNLNPDGLGQVLIYPYYTSNAGNATILSVVNTTESAKAVKVRFKEGFNSREVLDFNMYMSAFDVWVAAIADDAGTPTLYIPDSTCTVPYLYENDSDPSDDTAPGDFGYTGSQAFLPYDYTGKNADGGPTSIQRAAEGYFEMIEMGTLTNDSENPKAKVVGSADAATHVVDADGVQAPLDCQQLVDAWTSSSNPKLNGYWIDTTADPTAHATDIARNSGGLFGGAAVINVANGTMFSYDARAIQGFDSTADGHLHAQPGNSSPSLNSGRGDTANDAWVFFGVPSNTAVQLFYERPVDAVSAVFMHEYTMNEYNIQPGLNAASEWVMTFPTKNWYVDTGTVGADTTWIPSVSDPGCNDWQPGEDFPALPVDSDNKPIHNPPRLDQGEQFKGWTSCTYVKSKVSKAPIPPFTSVFKAGGACEPFNISIFDREEDGDEYDSSSPPIVSPPPPPGSGGEDDVICYEVNVLRFGNDEGFPVIFGTPDIQGASLLKTVDAGYIEYDKGTKSKDRVNGWAQINWFSTDDNFLNSNPEASKDFNGLVGLPVTGFWAEQFENGYLVDDAGDTVLSNYGGLFSHKGNVRRVCPSYRCRQD